MQVRMVVASEASERVREHLVADPRVTHVVWFPGAGLSPAGDVLICDVTREATGDVLSFLKSVGVYEHGSVAVSEVLASPSADAAATERAAPGAPDDAIVWDAVVDRARAEVRGSWAYYVFLSLACAIAAVAVITDSSILVVGAMVVGPEFAVVAAVAVGLVVGDRPLVGRALALLAGGFGVAIVVTCLLALLGRAVGLITLEDVTGPRPLTAFIWSPDVWSAVVAVLAGCAGVLSQTAGKSNALVGVFISVTTVPAAGDFALSLAFGAPAQLAGSAMQLGINLAGMTVAGVVTLLVQRALIRLRHRPVLAKSGQVADTSRRRVRPN